MFVANLLVWGIVTAVIARILGVYGMIDSGTAGAINYVISKIGILILVAITGPLSPTILMAIKYGLSAYVIMRFTGLDIIKSIVVAVVASYASPLVFPMVYSLLSYF